MPSSSSCPVTWRQRALVLAADEFLGVVERFAGEMIGVPRETGGPARSSFSTSFIEIDFLHNKGFGRLIRGPCRRQSRVAGNASGCAARYSFAAQPVSNKTTITQSTRRSCFVRQSTAAA